MATTDELGAILDRMAATLGGRLRRDAPIGELTTYRVGGRAAALIEAGDADDLDAIAALVAGTDVATVVIGRGSNLLVADGGFAGLAIVLGDGFESIDIDDTIVVAGGAARLPVVARATAVAGLTGFEWAVGVPGSIGGAVRMNAGGHGADMAASLRTVDVVDLGAGGRVTLTTDELALGYRTSAIGDDQVVASATLELAHGDPERCRDELREIVAWRRANQPGGQNAGSVFTNPPGDSAGRLIEAAGCKGLRLGSAEVSTKHANFIQADDGGSADDIAALMREIRRRVLDHAGVELHAETHLVGFGEADRR